MLVNLVSYIAQDKVFKYMLKTTENFWILLSISKKYPARNASHGRKKIPACSTYR